jgi:hypothetical protein
MKKRIIIFILIASIFIISIYKIEKRVNDIHLYFGLLSVINAFSYLIMGITNIRQKKRGYYIFFFILTIIFIFLAISNIFF